MVSILLIEDDPSVRENLADFLTNEGFSVISAEGQTAAFKQLEGKEVDLILLDISLADGNGFSICSEIKSKMDVPVIFLTASGDEFSVVTAFDIGADDYISKPFRPRELVSRIKNALRRRKKSSPVIEIDDIKIDTDRAAVSKGGSELFLSALEYRLLLILANNRGTVLSRVRLLDELWDVDGDFVNDNTLTVYIKRLRDKIEANPQNPNIIKTIRGIGYRID